MSTRADDARDPRIQAIRGRASGLSRRRRHRRRDFLIRQARRRGLSYRELGRRFRVSHVMAWKVCRRRWLYDRPWIEHPRGPRKRALTEPVSMTGRVLKWLRIETESGIWCFPMVGDYAREAFLDRAFRRSRDALVTITH